MLAIRLQRTGRRGHAQYRVIVQDARKAPTSGKVVKYLGSYNPHTKKAAIKKELAEFYLKNGAQPSDRVVSLLKKEGIKLPEWVKISQPKQRKTRNPEKLRKNQPVEQARSEESTAEITADTPGEQVAQADTKSEASTEESAKEANSQNALESAEKHTMAEKEASIKSIDEDTSKKTA